MYDLVCFSHLRWDFVFQRPNHLMARAARDHRVLFIEEPIVADRAGLSVARREGVTVVTPTLPDGLAREDADIILRQLVQRQITTEGLRDPVRWYWTPMALRWSYGLPAAAVVYDCMDELSAFQDAPPDLLQEEERLLAAADLVFTGGTQLYESKRRRHPSVHRLPSSVDRAHFARARTVDAGDDDQAAIGPRLGWFGVIDERFDRDLVAAVAAARPDWQLVLVGPIVKVDPALLPTAPNIHYLGPKPYDSLPDYLAGWDVGIMPFALNESTRYISPTKTPEYLAAGLPVVSTAIADVVEPYGTEGLVSIARDVAQFIEGVEHALTVDLVAHRQRADHFLSSMSWQNTWDRIDTLISGVVASRHTVTPRVVLPSPSRVRIVPGIAPGPVGVGARIHNEP